MSAGIRISLDGRGRWIDNVFIERLWRSLKYEEVYLKGYGDGREARTGIATWIGFYNGRRPHQVLAGRTPMAVRREGYHRATDRQCHGHDPPHAGGGLDDARAAPPRQQQPTPHVA